MADEDAQIRQAVKYFVGLAGGKSMTEEQKKEVNDKASSKLMKECCAQSTGHVAESSTFPFLAGKAKKISIDRYVNEFLPELAIAIVHKKLLEKDRKAAKPTIDNNEKAAALLKTIRSEIAAKHDMKTKGTAASGVTQRLTDTSKYTGAHKERFDESGKGKGIKGREDVASNAGYVSGYKHEGTYDGAKK